jgi:hypothetical protein
LLKHRRGEALRLVAVRLAKALGVPVTKLLA